MLTLKKAGDLKPEELSSLLHELWINPGRYQQKTGLSIKALYEILSELESLKCVKGYYKLHCTSCDIGLDELFETFSSMPTTFVCPNCNKSVLSIKNSTLIYKVLI